MVLKNDLSVKCGGNASIAENSSWEGKNKAIIAVVWVNVPRVANKWTLTRIDATFRRPRTLMKPGKRNKLCNWPSEKNGSFNKEETPQWGYEPFDPIQKWKTRNNQTSIRNHFKCFCFYFYVESMQNTGKHITNLVVEMTAENTDPKIFHGPRCVDHF